MVPEGWRTQKLGELFEEVRRRGGGDLPVLTVSKDLGIVLQTEKFGRILASDDRSRYKKIRWGEFAYDPMLLWSGSIARQKRVRQGVVSPAYYVFTLVEGTAHPDFMEQFLTASRMNTHYEAISEGTNTRRRKAQFDAFSSMEFPFPPLPEQKKIAEILSSADEAIAATRKAIEQAERVKKGLLQTLMTRGIGHTRFKQTEIGEIPEAWEVRPGRSLFSLFSGRKPSELVTRTSADEYLYLKVGDFNDPRNRVALRFSELGFSPDNPSGVRVHEPGAVVFPKRGAAIFGERALLLGKRGTVDPNLMVMESKGPDPEFLRLYLLHHGMGAICDNAGIPQINNKHLYPMSFPVPSDTEQTEIVSQLSVLRQDIEVSVAALNQLQHLKRGLLQDLLTGRVRVPVD